MINTVWGIACPRPERQQGGAQSVTLFSLIYMEKRDEEFVWLPLRVSVLLQPISCLDRRGATDAGHMG
jgi:hypothetical protein